MSFHRASAFDITPGTAFEAFVAGTANPSIPQAMYRPRAAGPAHLTGLGAHVYMAPLRQQKLNLRGFGEDPGASLMNLGAPAIQQAAQIAINAMWPTLQAKLDEQFKGMKVLVMVTAGAAAAAAALSYLTWSKQSGY